MRYASRPIEIDAVEWQGVVHEIPASWRRTGAIWQNGDDLVIQTLRGPSDVPIGDFIVRRRTGEMYPVDPITFAEHYEAVGE
jgi:hypothetical protein